MKEHVENCEYPCCSCGATGSGYLYHTHTMGGDLVPVLFRCDACDGKPFCEAMPDFDPDLEPF